MKIPISILTAVLCLFFIHTAQAQSIEQREISCQDNPMNAACFSCFGKEHHLVKLDECSEDFNFEYDEIQGTASVLKCREGIPSENNLGTDSNDPNLIYCGSPDIEYDPDTNLCCRRSDPIPLCPCDNPQDMGNATCNLEPAQQDEKVDTISRNISNENITRRIDNAYADDTRSRLTYGGPGLWAYVHCLFPEQVSHWQGLGVDVNENEQGGYTLYMETDTRTCERIQAIVSETYDPNPDEANSLSLAGERISCAIDFPACQCSDTPPDDTEDDPSDDPIEIPEAPEEPVIVAEPTTQPTTQICIGAADDSKVLCNNTAGILHTDRRLLDDLMAAPVFESELGNPENWQRYQTLIHIWKDLQAGRITEQEAQNRMTGPATFLVEKWLAKNTDKLTLKSIQVSQEASSDGTYSAALGNLSRDEIAIGSQAFSSALNEGLAGKDTYITVPLMWVKVKGGACGASLIGQGTFGGSNQSMLWLCLATLLLLAGVQWRTALSK